MCINRIDYVTNTLYYRISIKMCKCVRSALTQNEITAVDSFRFQLDFFYVFRKFLRV